MLLLWWYPFKIQKEKRKGHQFTSPDYLSLLLTPLRIRKLVAGSFLEKFPDPTKWYGFDRSWPTTRFEGSERMVCTFESTKCLEVEVEYLESVVWYLQERNLSFCYLLLQFTILEKSVCAFIADRKEHLGKFLTHSDVRLTCTLNTPQACG
jgi:hypothetical protein